MMKLSGFADEISADLQEQIAVLKSLGLQYIEIRSAWKKNILTWTDEEVDEVRRTLDEHRVQVSAVASRIGKMTVDEDNGQALRELERAIVVAERLQTRNIRIFSFNIPEGQHHAQHRDAVMEKMRSMVRLAEQSGMVLLLENEAGMYGDTQKGCLDILQEMASPNIQLAFDPGNLVQCNARPFTDEYPPLKEYVSYIHVKDVDEQSQDEVLPGDGAAEIEDLVRQLQRIGYTGFLSLEPHLRNSKYRPDLTHPELFALATNAFKQMLDKNNVSWE